MLLNNIYFILLKNLPLKIFSNKLSLILIAMGFLYSTTYHINFLDAVSWVGANDVYSYLIIARSAPFFPGESVSFHFAQRWIPHYLVGLMAKGFNINLFLSYIILNGFFILVILMQFYNIILRSVLNKWLGIVMFLFLTSFIFSFRLYIFVPGLLADLLFVLGLALSIRGCLDEDYKLIVIGLILAIIGKQITLLVLPGLTLYFYSIWIKSKSRKVTLGLIGFFLLITLLCYMFLSYTASIFGGPNALTLTILLSIFPWLLSDRYSLALLFEHIFRILLPLFPFIVIIVMSPSKWQEKRVILSTTESYALILVILGPMAYAFLPGPEFLAGNQSRFTGLALLPMSILTLKFLKNIKICLSPFDFIWLLGVFLCLTYHHRYTIFQSTPITFFITQMIGISALIGWLIIRKKALISK